MKAGIYTTELWGAIAGCFAVINQFSDAPEWQVRCAVIGGCTAIVVSFIFARAWEKSKRAQSSSAPSAPESES